MPQGCRWAKMKGPRRTACVAKGYMKSHAPSQNLAAVRLDMLLLS